MEKQSHNQDPNPQASKMESFFNNSQQPQAVNYCYKYLHFRYLHGIVTQEITSHIINAPSVSTRRR